MSQRKLSILLLSAFGAIVLSQFQNCAPAPSSSIAAGGPQTDSQVRLIDDLAKAELQFVQSEVQLHDEAPAADVGGLCNRSRNGAKLKWTIVDQDSAKPLMVGESVCERGQFSLNLSALDQMVCGVNHQLVVEGEWGASAHTNFMRRCQPVVSEPVQAPESSPYGTECSLEYTPGSELACAQVCYRQKTVMQIFELDKSKCSDLAARLAGH
jgi:hypothetical protein